MKNFIKGYRTDVTGSCWTVTQFNAIIIARNRLLLVTGRHIRLVNVYRIACTRLKNYATGTSLMYTTRLMQRVLYEVVVDTKCRDVPGC